jgi:hypothetical protein
MTNMQLSWVYKQMKSKPATFYELGVECLSDGHNED